MALEEDFGEYINFSKKKNSNNNFWGWYGFRKNPEICKAIKNSDYEVASHGWRWIDYQNIKNLKKKSI